MLSSILFPVSDLNERKRGREAEREREMPGIVL